MSRHKPSYLSVTDLFCGAGGSSLGAEAAGARLVLGINHWQQAIATHAENFAHADHDCRDVSETHPSRYRSTHILVASPECTAWTNARGKRRNFGAQLALGEDFEPLPTEAEERSRATMWDRRPVRRVSRLPGGGGGERGRHLGLGPHAGLVPGHGGSRLSASGAVPELDVLPQSAAVARPHLRRVQKDRSGARAGLSTASLVLGLRARCGGRADLEEPAPAQGSLPVSVPLLLPHLRRGGGTVCLAGSKCHRLVVARAAHRRSAPAAGGSHDRADPRRVPDSYVVLGNQRVKVRQYGQAVTPPTLKLEVLRELPDSSESHNRQEGVA